MPWAKPTDDGDRLRPGGHVAQQDHTMRRRSRRRSVLRVGGGLLEHPVDAAAGNAEVLGDVGRLLPSRHRCPDLVCLGRHGGLPALVFALGLVGQRRRSVIHPSRPAGRSISAHN
jgi:hypothetical protein